MKLRLPADVAWVARDPDGDHPQVFAMRVPTGAPLVLADWGALVWLAAIRGELDADWIAALPNDEVRASLDGFVADLVAQGLLDRADSGNDAALAEPS